MFRSFRDHFARIDAQKAAPTLRSPQVMPRRIPNVRWVVPVASGKGGVGKSTTAVNLALALSALGRRVGVLDADLFGPSLPRMMNLRGDHAPDVGRSGGMLPLRNYGIECMSMGFLVPEDKAVVWRGLMVMKALQQLLLQVEWSETDILIVDMPPGTGDTQLTLCQQVQVSGAVIVSTPQDIALADARKGIEMFAQVKVPVLGLVQNMSHYACPQCGHHDPVFGRDGVRRLTQTLGVPLLGEVALNAQVCDSMDHGRPIVVSQPQSVYAQAYRSMAEKVLERLEGLKEETAKEGESAV